MKRLRAAILALTLASPATAAVPPLEQVPGIVLPPAPNCAGPLQAATQSLMADMESQLASCKIGGGIAGSVGGAVGQVAQAIAAGKQNAQEIGSNSKMDILTGASSGAGAGKDGRVTACPSIAVPNVEDMTCTEIKNEKAFKANIDTVVVGISCTRDAVTAAQCGLDTIAKAAANMENLGAQVCGPLLDAYLSAAQTSAAVRQQIIDERKEQIKDIEGKLSKVQQAGQLIQKKQAELKGKLEMARRNARNIAARRAALAPAREANKISLVMQCVQDEVIPGAKCNPGDAAAPSYSVKEYIERCWLKSLSSTGNLAGEAAGAKSKRQAAAEQVKAWLAGIGRKAPAPNAEYEVEKAGTDAQVIGAIPSSGISNLRELNGYISTFPTVDADASGSMKKVLKAGIQACWDNSTIEQQLNTRWNAVGKKIVADEEDMLRFHKNDLTDVQYVHNDISTLLTGNSAKIDTSNCESANRIESVQACLETYETNLKQFLTGDNPLKQIQYDRQPDGTLRQKVTGVANPFAVVPLGFPTKDPALAALGIPPPGPVAPVCKGVDNCNAELTKLKSYAEAQGKAAEADKKKVTQAFQAAATAFKSGVTNALGAASSQIRNRLQAVAAFLAKARITAPKLKALEAREQMEMAGKEPTEGVPAPGQNWSEIFNTGANLLDPNSLKPEDLEKRLEEVKDAEAKLQRQLNLKESKLAECLKKEVDEFGKQFDKVLGTIDEKCMEFKYSDNTPVRSGLSELAKRLQNVVQFRPEYQAQITAIDETLSGLLRTDYQKNGLEGMTAFEQTSITGACPKSVNTAGLEKLLNQAVRKDDSSSSTSAESKR